jgi:chitinase
MIKYFFVSVCSFLMLTGCTSEQSKKDTKKSTKKDLKVIAYVHRLEDNWGKDLEKALQITHINYAFANIKDGKVIEGNPSDTATFKKLNKLKKVNEHLKILISVGGWGWSGGFSDAVLTPASRQVFANSAIDFMLRHKIDGIDLDWEYPGLIGNGNVHRPEDKENFTEILKLLRKKLDSMSTENDSYLLTIATGAFQDYLDHTNMREAHKYLDFINIMTYDFYGGGDRVTGHHANFKATGRDDYKPPRSSRIAVQQHVDAGIPVNKLVLGVPFYGKWWKGTQPAMRGLYQPTTGKTGTYNYDDLVDSLAANTGFNPYWDDDALAPYIWRKKDSMFITYENPRSIKLKVDYVKNEQLGGIMFWQFNGDNGSLLNAIYDNLYVKTDTVPN